MAQRAPDSEHHWVCVQREALYATGYIHITVGSSIFPKYSSTEEVSGACSQQDMHESAGKRPRRPSALRSRCADTASTKLTRDPGRMFRTNESEHTSRSTGCAGFGA